MEIKLTLFFKYLKKITYFDIVQNNADNYIYSISTGWYKDL